MEMLNYILVVEDSNTQAEQLKHILEKNGYAVKVASNGKIALQLIYEEKPQIIISDIIMPEMDGYELSSKLKSDPDYRDIPFILLTSLSDPNDVIRGLQAGADNFLTKPYNEKFLISRIQYILINKELRKNYSSNVGMELVFAGQKYFINSDRMQIVDLLLSTYENAIQKNDELLSANRELIKMQQELENKNDMLEKLNADKNKFLGIAAHDLRNPLSVILNFSIILLDELYKNLNNDQKYFLDAIQTSSEFCLQLLNELLDISVIESGEINLNLQKHDIVKLIKSNLKLHRVNSDKKNIELVYDCDYYIPDFLLDKTKFEQVLNNLISNAIKYSPTNKKIYVCAKLTNEEVIVRIKDEGLGIPENELDRLFKPFPKISSKPTSGERSTGLGLTIVKKIVEAHHGKVWVESELKKGSTFYVMLPFIQNK